MKWTPEGGFRSNWVARRTNGKLGLGKWTQAEVHEVILRARAKYGPILRELKLRDLEEDN